MNTDKSVVVATLPPVVPEPAASESTRTTESTVPANPLEAQRAQILEFIKPGYRYDGWFTCTNWAPRTSKVTVVFGDYEGPDQSAISGVYYLTDAPAYWQGFQLQLKPDRVAELPMRWRKKEVTEDVKPVLKTLTGEVREDARQLFHYNCDAMSFGIVDGKLVAASGGTPAQSPVR